MLAVRGENLGLILDELMWGGPVCKFDPACTGLRLVDQCHHNNTNTSTPGDRPLLACSLAVIPKRSLEIERQILFTGRVGVVQKRERGGGERGFAI